MAMSVNPRMLDPQQRRAIEMAVSDGNCFIKGEAGTGKSIVLAHAVTQWKIKHPDSRICVLSYTNSLVALLEHELEGRGVPVMTIHEFMGSRHRNGHWDCVFVDEVQDMAVEWACKIKSRSDKFVLVGDFGQLLYDELYETFDDNERKTKEKKGLCEYFGIDERHVIMLGTDYRLPRNCRRVVSAIFRERKLESAIHRLMANAEVTAYAGHGWDDEMAFVVEKARRTARPGTPSAVIFEQKRRIFRFLYTVDQKLEGEKIDLKTVNEKLSEHGVPFRFLGNGIGDLHESDAKPLTYVMTWHSAKGLDFETVIVPDLGASQCRENPFYVALTRARRNLVLTYSGQSVQVEKALQCDCVKLLKRERPSSGPEIVERGMIQDDLFGNGF